MNRSDKNHWVDLFQQLPEEGPSPFFREEMMQQIYKETARRKKRNTILSLASLVIASLVMIGMAVFVFFYLEIPKIQLVLPDIKGFSFYIYIAILALGLLGLDYKIRQKYKRWKLKGERDK